MRVVRAAVEFAAALRAKQIAGLATLVLAGTSSGVAVAGRMAFPPHSELDPNYTVKLEVSPTVVRLDERVALTVHTHAPHPAELALFFTGGLRGVACEQNAGLMFHRRSTFLVFRKTVDGARSERINSIRPVGTGTHHFCAYLYKVHVRSDTLARAEASFRAHH